MTEAVEKFCYINKMEELKESYLCEVINTAINERFIAKAEIPITINDESWTEPLRFFIELREGEYFEGIPFQHYLLCMLKYFTLLFLIFW